MTIIDYSGIAVAAIFSQDRPEEIQEGLIRHMILNQIRRYNLQFREEYGQTIIACDGGSWRKDVYEHYKAKRKTSRDESPLDWGEFFRLINMVRDEIKEHFPYPVIQVDKAEADDIIATLTKNTQEFGKHEPVVIVSADKDFLQLQRYNNVKQYSPNKRGFITVEDAEFQRFDHICRGCGGDGVPNTQSVDNAIVDGIRQTPMRKKKIQEWYENRDNLESVMDTETYRNFQRNQMLIDFDFIPNDMVDKINEEIEKASNTKAKGILNYLIAKRCSMLVEAAADFQSK